MAEQFYEETGEKSSAGDSELHVHEEIQIWRLCDKRG